MTQKELIDDMAGGLLNRKQALETLVVLSEIVAACLASGDEVTLPGIGKLRIRSVAERQGRNPQTGEALTIPAHKAVHFSPAKALKDALK